MKAFNNSNTLKDKFLDLLVLPRNERKAAGKKISLPSSIADCSAMEYEQCLGIPRALATLLENYDSLTSEHHREPLMAHFLSKIEVGRELENFTAHYINLILSAPLSLMNHANKDIQQLSLRICSGHKSNIDAVTWRSIRKEVAQLRAAQTTPLQRDLVALIESCTWRTDQTMTVGSDAQQHDLAARGTAALVQYGYTDDDEQYQADMTARLQAGLHNCERSDMKKYMDEFMVQEPVLNPEKFQRLGEINRIRVGQVVAVREIHRSWLLSLI